MNSLLFGFFKGGIPMYEHNHFMNYIILALSVLAITIAGMTYSLSMKSGATARERLAAPNVTVLQVTEDDAPAAETPVFF